MKAASLSFFRFEGLGSKLWAFSQMQFARRPLAAVPGIGFHKLLGSGTREGFHPFPNFSVYAILATWPSLEEGRARIADDAVYQRYRGHAAEHWTVFLEATQSRGRWAGAAPFDVAEPGQEPETIAVLTRASVKATHVLAFWRRVPNISATIREQDHLLFKIGLGEIPWLHQVTFSIWRDRGAMEAFAYRGFHAEAIRQVRKDGWFSEELFTRFQVLQAEGQWEGAEPLAEAPGHRKDESAFWRSDADCHKRAGTVSR